MSKRRKSSEWVLLKPDSGYARGDTRMRVPAAARGGPRQVHPLRRLRVQGGAFWEADHGRHHALRYVHECVETPDESASCRYIITYLRPAAPRVFYYRDCRTMESADTSEGVDVPMFELKDSVAVARQLGLRNGYREDLERLIVRVEFRIITMVYDLVRRFDINLRLDGVVIPVKSKVCGFLPNGYPWVKANLGIAIFGVERPARP